MQNLDALLSGSASAHPERTAVVDPNVAAIGYRDLDEQASIIADILKRHKLTRGDRVAVHAPKSVGTVASIFGISRAGGVYVPVDPSAPARRNVEIMSDCSVHAVVTDEIRAKRLEEQLGRPLEVLDELDGLNQWGSKLVLLAYAGEKHSENTDRDLAYILYTSGSTGTPKGVMHTHASALSFIDWCSEEFAPTPEDRFSSHAPFHFDLSILDLYVPLKHGATVVLISDEVGKKPSELAPLIEEHRLTVWYSTPSILRLLLEYGKLAERDTSQLRLVLFAGEVFPIKHLQALGELWPGKRLYNLYGPTETNVCTFYEVSTSSLAERSEPVPIGFTCSGDDARVVDPDGRNVAPGEEGELLVSGGSVMVGYWNRPELTESAFSVDSDGRRWYRTGDVVADKGGGCFRFLGRRDRMVKRRGYRVELGEIESALYRHPRVQEAAVLALPDEESGVLIKAFLCCADGKPPSIVELKQFCASNLPLYMVPDRFRTLDALPKTSTDKIDYQTLAGLG